ncbi:tetratricopeptide repeat-containing sensor histidine kinase [Aquimarina litoralis]|uniref:tetratricopeptide repeat-containing sensor histidine kinase n=1 Tax=Aquimarina litoralis TaxID=584605 RepID=UPI001C565D47|nr:sensor histidine kinase [Aquimarina litoralis]MBW1294537.1 tetratricopeptide repeat protein [Aquimarina litoralis]
MLQFSKFSFIIFLCSICHITNAQIDTKEKSKDIDYDYQLLEKARIYSNTEGEDKRKAFLISHEVLERTQNDYHKVLAYKNLSHYHYYSYVSDSAIFYAKKGVTLTEKRQDSLGVSLTNWFYLVLSNASRDKGLLDDSKKWALKGLETVKLIDDTEIEKKLLLNLGITYRMKGDPKKALEIYNSMIIGDENPNPDLYVSIAICHLEMGNFEKALQYQNKALNIYSQETNNRSVAIALLNIGAIYIEIDEANKALEYFEKSLKIAEEYKYPLIKLNNKFNIAEVLMTKKQYKKATKNFEDVLVIAKEREYFQQQILAYQKLKELAILQKNYENALEYTEKKNKLNDSVNQLQKDEELSKLEVQYETLKKENEISILKKDQELRELEIKRQQSQKYTILIAFIIVLILLIGWFVLYYQKLKSQNLLNKNQKELAEQKIEALIKNHGLKLIQNSINVQFKERKRIAQTLHDRIGGNLAAIKLQISSAKNGSSNLAQVYKQIEDTYQEVRVLSHDLIPKKIADSNFTDLLDEYIDKISTSSNLTIDISTYQEDYINQMDVRFHNELFSVFQELITNTVKHANASKIGIQINIIEDQVSIIFEDNGKGFDPSKIPLGIGLTNIESRIQELSGTLHIDSLAKRGTIITIEIPVMNQHKMINAEEI